MSIETNHVKTLIAHLPQKNLSLVELVTDFYPILYSNTLEKSLLPFIQEFLSPIATHFDHYSTQQQLENHQFLHGIIKIQMFSTLTTLCPHELPKHEKTALAVAKHLVNFWYNPNNSVWNQKSRTNSSDMNFSKQINFIQQHTLVQAKLALQKQNIEQNFEQAINHYNKTIHKWLSFRWLHTTRSRYAQLDEVLKALYNYKVENSNNELSSQLTLIKTLTETVEKIDQEFVEKKIKNPSQLKISLEKHLQNMQQINFECLTAWLEASCYMPCPLFKNREEQGSVAEQTIQSLTDKELLLLLGPKTNWAFLIEQGKKQHPTDLRRVLASRLSKVLNLESNICNKQTKEFKKTTSFLKRIASLTHLTKP